MSTLLQEFFRRQPRVAWASMLLNFVSSILTIAVLGAIGGLITGPSHLSIASIATLIVALLLSGSAGLALAKMQAIRTQDAVRVEFVETLGASDFRSIEKQDPHELLAIFSDDIQKLADGLALLPNVVTSIALLICGMGYVFWISAEIAGVTLLISILGSAILGRLIGLTRGWLAEARTHLDRIHFFVHASLFGAKEMHQQPAAMDGWLRPRLTTEIAAHIKTTDRVGTTWSLVQNATVTSLLITLVVAALIAPRVGLTSQSTATVLLILIYLRPAIQMLVTNIPDLAAASIAMDRLQSVRELREVGEIRSTTDYAPLFPRELSAKNLVYSYAEGQDRFVLGPIDLTLCRGEALFVYGGNGAGKSTLLSLLAGLYQPDSGDILLDGNPTHMGDLRRSTTLVAQQPNLFWPPLDQAGHPRPWDEVTPYLRRFGLPEVMPFSDMQKAHGLSGGQLKRLAILHACLDDRPYIIFDEPTADQDGRFRTFFFEQVIPDLLAKGRAVIIVTHDEEQASRANVVLRMERGNPAVAEHNHAISSSSS